MTRRLACGQLAPPQGLQAGSPDPQRTVRWNDRRRTDRSPEVLQQMICLLSSTSPARTSQHLSFRRMKCRDPITDERNVLLHRHTTPRKQGLTRVRVSFYTTPAPDRYEVFITELTGPESDAAVISTIRVNLTEVTTEYAAQFYASIQNSLAEEMSPETPFQKEEGLEPSAENVLPHQGRKADTSIEHIRPYFSLPINEASKKLGICSTSLKKICRAHGMQRWPYRKFKSVETKMAVTNCQSTPQPPPDPCLHSLDGWDAHIPEAADFMESAAAPVFMEPAPVFIAPARRNVYTHTDARRHQLSRLACVSA